MHAAAPACDHVPAGHVVQLVRRGAPWALPAGQGTWEVAPTEGAVDEPAAAGLHWACPANDCHVPRGQGMH